MHTITLPVILNNSIHFCVDIASIALDVYAFNMVNSTALKGYRRWLVWFIVGDILGLVFRLCVISGVLGVHSFANFSEMLEQTAFVGEGVASLFAVNILTKMTRTAIDQSRYVNLGSTAGYTIDTPNSPGVWPPPPI